MLKKKKASESSTISATAWTPVISLGAEAKKCLLKSSGKNVIFKKMVLNVIKIYLFT